MTHARPGTSILPLVEDLFGFTTGVVSPDNELYFARLQRELPFTLHRYRSGTSFNGWIVPDSWCVERARLSRDGRTVFDGAHHPMGVAAYSRSFQGELSWEDLQPHVVTNPALSNAYTYHCMWQYRPWAADWAFSVPHDIYRTLGPGRYQIDLATRYDKGDMIVAEYLHRGRSDRTVVFNAHTCHPMQANDDLAGVAVLSRLFQWLQGQATQYTYRLVLGPEHLGTVFYLRDRPPHELRNLVAGAFAEMPGGTGAIRVASTFLGDQPIDRAFRHAARHCGRRCEMVPWRQGAGNDETVWEAPGYEVPFVEISRAHSLWEPFPEYHTSLDTPDRLGEAELDEFLAVLRRVVDILETNAVIHRRFTGLICLSNPQYDLYVERPDPAVSKQLQEDSDKWGILADSVLRYFDGRTSILDIADRHDLPFHRVRDYIRRFEEKGLVRLEPVLIDRRPISVGDEIASV